MRLHTKLTCAEVHRALEQAKKAGHVAPDVRFTTESVHSSVTHLRAFEVQLGTYCKTSLPAGYTDQHGHRLSVRRYKNSGAGGAASDDEYGRCAVWAATWHEWGWFMAGVFAADPGARFGTAKGWHYAGRADFDRKTEGVFRGACEEEINHDTVREQTGEDA
jgi:hypothetical protein